MVVFEVEELVNKLMDSVARRSKLLDDDRSLDEGDDGSFRMFPSCASASPEGRLSVADCIRIM